MLGYQVGRLFSPGLIRQCLRYPTCNALVSGNPAWIQVTKNNTIVTPPSPLRPNGRRNTSHTTISRRWTIFFRHHGRLSRENPPYFLNFPLGENPSYCAHTLQYSLIWHTERLLHGELYWMLVARYMFVTSYQIPPGVRLVPESRSTGCAMRSSAKHLRLPNCHKLPSQTLEFCIRLSPPGVCTMSGTPTLKKLYTVSEKIARGIKQTNRC